MVAVAYPHRGPVLELVAPPAPTPARRPTPATYRRRRLAVAALALALAGLAILGAAALFVAAPAEPAVASRPVAARPASAVAAESPAASPAASGVSGVTVRPGDTLWSLARRAQPEGDVRPLVARLSAARGGRPLQIGERVSLNP